MQDCRLVLNLGEVCRAGYLFLVFAVDDRQLRQLDLPVLLKGKIDGLRKSQFHRGVALRLAGEGKNQLRQRTEE